MDPRKYTRKQIPFCKPIEGSSKKSANDTELTGPNAKL